jgi:hypothetical protein
VTRTPPDEQIDSVVRRLAATLDVPRSEIEGAVRAAFEGWNGARVRDFVPIFVERELRARFGLSPAGSPPRIASGVAD